jgi:hypothetical protein
VLQEGRAVDRISPKLEPPISMPLSRPSSIQQRTHNHRLNFDTGLQQIRNHYTQGNSEILRETGSYNNAIYGNYLQAKVQEIRTEKKKSKKIGTADVQQHTKKSKAFTTI